MEGEESASSEQKNSIRDVSKTGSEERKREKEEIEEKSERKVLKKYQLWKYADKWDVFLIIVGILAAFVNGSFYSIAMYILKDLFNAINDEEIIDVDEVFFLSLYLVISPKELLETMR